MWSIRSRVVIGPSHEQAGGQSSRRTVHGHDPDRQLSAVPDPADAGADGAAAAGRRAQCLEQRDAGLSGAAAGGLLLCAPALPIAAAAAGASPPRAVCCGRADPAGRLGPARPASAGQRSVVGAVAAGHQHRPGVFRGLGAGPADAALVRRASRCGPAVGALCRQQSGQLWRADRLSLASRTTVAAAPAGVAVERRLRPAGGADRAVRAGALGNR